VIFAISYYDSHQTFTWLFFSAFLLRTLIEFRRHPEIKTMSAITKSPRLTAALAAVVALSAAAPALAETQSRNRSDNAAPARNETARVWRTVASDAPPLGAQRVVMACEQGAIARRNFERRFGQAPVFVTASQALAARDAGQTWSTPRCMTERELYRLTDGQ